MKSIILYYSKSGKTEKLAKKAAAALGSDILKVELVKPYGNMIFAIFRYIKERKKGIIPTVKTQIPALDSYDTVLIGYPVWGSDVPHFLADFVKKCSLKGKKVIPFATSGSTDIDCTLKTLKEICPESEVVHPFLQGHSKKDDFDKWIEAVRGS
jgi:flavodoxin